LNADYFAPAENFRVIYPEQYSPLSVDVSPDEKRIEVDIGSQSLKAYESDRVVLQAPISSGVYSQTPSPNGIPTETPIGSFHIQLKMPSSHMGDGRLTADREAYELPGVPWTCVFHTDGIALHGTYWHNNFGHRMSHGCINLRNSDALWLFRWVEPIFSGEKTYQQGWGTPVLIQ
jgi:lipoprotein-anchoring transpeptidase ErfK/SrfK